jgi:hypothetical protein
LLRHLFFWASVYKWNKQKNFKKNKNNKIKTQNTLFDAPTSYLPWWYDIRGSYLHKDTEKQILINKIFSLLHCMYKISSDIQLANCYHVNLNNQSGEITSWYIKQCVLSFYFVVSFWHLYHILFWQMVSTDKNHFWLTIIVLLTELERDIFCI